MKRKKAREEARLAKIQEPIYPELKDFTLRDFINKFYNPLLFLYLGLCLIPFLLLGFHSLPLIIVVLLTFLLNALYAGIMSGKDPNGMGNWNCASILRRLLLGIILPGYILFSLVVIITFIWYITNSSNLFSASPQTSLTGVESPEYFRR